MLVTAHVAVGAGCIFFHDLFVSGVFWMYLQKKNQGMESSILQENHFLCICFTWKSLKEFVNIKIPFHCFGLTYTNDNYVIGYHWPVRRERTRQCLHFLLSALRSFHFAACTPIKLAASVTSLCELHSYSLRAHFTSRQLH